jgi:hypothetical protein
MSSVRVAHIEDVNARAHEDDAHLVYQWSDVRRVRRANGRLAYKGHGKGKDQEPLTCSFDLPLGSTDVKVPAIPESAWLNLENMTGTQVQWSSVL